MKGISASIIVLAGTILIVGGAYARAEGIQLFLMSVGCLVGLFGLAGWYVSLSDRQT